MAKKLRLTKKRQQYAQSRESVTLLGSPLRSPLSVEQRYARRIERITKQMTEEVTRELKKLFRGDTARAFFGEDASITSLNRKLINRLSYKYIGIFNQAGKPFAEQMLKGVNKSSKSAMFESLKKLSGGLTIKTDFISGDMKEILKASTIENVNLIKTIPRDYFEYVGGAVMRSITNPEEGGWSGLADKIDFMLDKKRTSSITTRPAT